MPLGGEEPAADSTRPRRGARRKPARNRGVFAGGGDNSNTQFALLGLWAAGRHGFDSDAALESIDGHFRSAQLNDGRWGYRDNMGGTEAMSCAGLMGLAIAASRPSLAERQTARARGAALAADPAFQAALRRSARMPARPVCSRTSTTSGRSSESAWRWAFGRSTGLTGTRTAHAILVDRQESDGGWPRDRWGRLPSTALALLFLRKANLAFEIDRVLRLPGPKTELALAAAGAGDPAPPSWRRPRKRPIESCALPMPAAPVVPTT